MTNTKNRVDLLHFDKTEQRWFEVQVMSRSSRGATRMNGLIVERLVDRLLDSPAVKIVIVEMNVVTNSELFLLVVITNYPLVFHLYAD